MTTKYLGLDSSTQSLTAMIIEEGPDGDSGSRIIYEKSLNFDQNFPGYGTRNGVLPGEKEMVHTPPQLWVEALDTLFRQMRAEGLDTSEILCIGTSGQQHGSVYLNASAEEALGKLNPERDLAEQLRGIYSRATSPIWMDSSTAIECAEITAALGGEMEVCRLTGSRAYERFTGPQIRRFFKSNPEAYANTRHIALVSSFIPSLLAGKIVSMDPGDGAGMNLMDIKTRDWSPQALTATAPGLAAKLPSIRPSHTLAGTISPYFAKKFGFSPDCQILVGTGDNPSSLIGLGLVGSGRLGISLGTSDTLFAFLSSVQSDPSGQSHVFGSPTGDYMAISVYKNGSLAREAVRNHFKLSWDAFSSILAQGIPGNRGRLMLPFFDTEIIPRINRAGVQRYGFTEEDTEANVQGVVEAQMIRMALHSEWMKEKPRQIHVTGGASTNPAILQVMANVFNAPVVRQETTSAAALGAAIRARHALHKSRGQAWTWEELVAPFVAAPPENSIRPHSRSHHDLLELKEKYRLFEGRYVKGLDALPGT